MLNCVLKMMDHFRARRPSPMGGGTTTRGRRGQVKMMNFVFKMMNFALKMMNCTFKMGRVT